MMVVFEVFLAPGADPERLLTEETKGSTGAQVMTPELARLAGFAGLPDYGDKIVRLIAVNKKDAPWIHRALETSDAVGRFSVNDVD